MQNLYKNLGKFVTDLKQKKCPQGSTIDLRQKNIDVVGVQPILQILQSGKCPTGLTIKLGQNNLHHEGARYIAIALQSGKCPVGLTIELCGNNLGNEGASHIASALQSGKCPSSLTVNLNDNKIYSKGFSAIASALKSGKCPTGLTIHLGANHLCKETGGGANYIADALQSGQCPMGLTINLSYTFLGANGISHIARALESGQCPPGLTIHLRGNRLGEGLDMGCANDIARALASGKCPPGLSIDLSDNMLTSDVACHFAAALESGKCPTALTVNLDNNSGLWCPKNDGIYAMVRALASEKCPARLTLALSGTLFGEECMQASIHLFTRINLPHDLYLSLYIKGFNRDLRIALAHAVRHSSDSARAKMHFKNAQELYEAVQYLLQAECKQISKNLEEKNSDELNNPLVSLLSFFYDLESLFPDEKINHELAGSILDIFSQYLHRHHPALRSTADATTVSTYYRYVDETLLPLISNWPKDLLQKPEPKPASKKSLSTSNQSDMNFLDSIEFEADISEMMKLCFRDDVAPEASTLSVRQLFRNACETLANLYNTSFDNHLLLNLSENTIPQELCVAQNALAMRAKLLQLVNYYQNEKTNIFHITLLRLADSFNPKPVTLRQIVDYSTALRNHAYTFNAWKKIVSVWLNKSTFVTAPLSAQLTSELTTSDSVAFSSSIAAMPDDLANMQPRWCKLFDATSTVTTSKSKSPSIHRVITNTTSAASYTTTSQRWLLISKTNATPHAIKDDATFFTRTAEFHAVFKTAKHQLAENNTSALATSTNTKNQIRIATTSKL